MNLRPLLVSLAIVVAFGIGLAVCHALPTGWRSIDWPLTLEAASNAAQVLALVVAGIWTYRLFVRQRLDHARANVTHKVDCVPLDSSHWLVKVGMQLQNVGNVPIRPPSAELAVHQITPLVSHLKQKLARGEGLVAEGETKVEWPKLGERKFDLASDDVFLEPGEIENLTADFIIPHDVERIEVLSTVACGEDYPGTFWDEASVHKLSNVAEPPVIADA